jgi:hypothetical protein
MIVAAGVDVVYRLSEGGSVADPDGIARVGQLGADAVVALQDAVQGTRKASERWLLT